MRLRVPTSLAAAAAALAVAAAPAVADPPTRIYKDQSYGGAYCYEWQHERGGDYQSGGWHDCHFRYSDSRGRSCHAWVRWDHDDWNRNYWEGEYGEYRDERCG
jgi:hypothetical protein